MFADWDENLSTKLIRPGVQEAQGASESDVRDNAGSGIVDPSGKYSCTRTRCWVTSTMARQHVKLDNARIGRKRVLVDAEADWVGEVVGKLAMHLEDVAIVYVPDNRHLGLKLKEWLED